MAVLLGSVLGGALLGGVALRARSRRRMPARDAGVERAKQDAVRALLDATRSSSDAVLAVLDRNVRAMECGVDAMLVFAARDGELACVYASGARAEPFRRVTLRREDLASLPARAAAAGCRAALPLDGAPLLPTDRAALAVPMLDAGGLRGVAYLSSCDARALADREALVLAVECAATPYSLALEREADRADATYDGLTGVLTPRAFRRLLHDVVSNAAPGGAPLSLWFVDTDRFKSVNDRFGHRAGDGVLQAMASLLEASLVADLDAAARNGGDEFCALVRAASKRDAIERAKAFCDAVRAHDFGLPVRVTASVGVATFPFDATSSSELLEAADAAMYHSKRAGRDRVSFALRRGEYAVFD